MKKPPQLSLNILFVRIFESMILLSTLGEILRLLNSWIPCMLSRHSHGFLFVPQPTTRYRLSHHSVFTSERKLP
ncbi:MAG TPA: hypothetical protein DCP63_07945 [Bacteroidetes bacterium]|nr:hypothetical protein [Bacteroidota bacterium]